ncbi:MAG: type I-E CRISPR-associated protein Cse2/CasB [Acidobacteriota bacterium]
MSEETQTADHAVVGYLKELAKRQDRAALAHLRRGLGKRPGEAMGMYPYIGRFISEKTNQSYDRAVFLTSALFADYWEAPSNAGNLGQSVRRLFDETKSDSIEKRFVALLDAEAEDLHYYLRQIVGLLKSKSIPVNWNELFKHIQGWDHPDGYVQKKWARSFWGSTDTNKSQNTNETGEESQ